MFTVFLRAAGAAIAIGAVLIVAAVQLDLGIGPVYLTGVVLLLAGVGGQFARNRRQRPRASAAAPTPASVGLPVTGRWRGLNSPATRVPSHGVHGLAQTWAIDLTHEPEGAPRRRLALLWPVMRGPAAYPSFGQPVLAPFDGEVVGVRGGHRDHLTRLSTLGVLYLFGEGFVRGLGAPRHILGNHVLVRADGGGAVAVLAHLRRGSLQVAIGDRVGAGQVLAECGNSGNSSDPHLHFQLMDGPDVETARGVPFEWDYSTPDGARRRGVPATDELFLAPNASAAAAEPDGRGTP